MQTSERVVVIKGNATNWYSQAVFILNPGISPNDVPIDFVAEAEKIIFDYMAKKGGVAAFNDRHQTSFQVSKKNGLTAPSACASTELDGKAKRRFPRGVLLYILMALACVGMAVIFGLGLLN